MKKRNLIIYFTLSMIISLFIVMSVDETTTATLPSIWIDDVGVVQTGVITPVSLWSTVHPSGNITGDNFSNYAKTSTNTSIFYMNYTKKNDSTSASALQFKYNTTSGPITRNMSMSLFSDCWSADNSKLMFRVNSSNDTLTTYNSRECAINSTHWTEMDKVYGQTEVFDARMQWKIKSRSMALQFNLSPDSYTIRNSTTIPFNWTVVDTLAGANNTQWNCSTYAKSSRNDNFTINASEQLTVNGSYVNRTFTYNQGDRIWWKLFCEDEYGRHIYNTSQRIFDIDLNFYLLTVVGNVNMTSNLYVDGCIKYNCSSVGAGCITLGECL